MIRSTTTLTIVGLVLAAVLFVSINVLGQRELTGARFDLTDRKLYTLSDGTLTVLSKIDEPVKLDFFFSKRLGEQIPSYGLYAQRVRELLQQYADHAQGKVILSIKDPEPFSATEDEATSAGLQGVPLDEGGEQVYFGLVGTNSTDDNETIPFFEADREKFLEYDVTKLIQTLAFPKKKVIGLVTELPVDVDMMAQMQGRPSKAQIILDQLRQTYEIRDLSTSFETIPEDIEVLMIVQPEHLAPTTEYAIDQWVLNGGHALVFADPDSEFQKSHPGMMARGASNAAHFDKLLKAWGVSLTEGRVVGDRLSARRVNAGGPGQSAPADYLAWLSLRGDQINRSSPITGQLGQINLATAGSLERIKDAKTSFEPLLESSAQAELIDTDLLQGMPDVLALLRDFKATGQRYVMAARITGPADTAFPDGPPKPDDKDKKPDAKPEKPPAPQIKTAQKPIDVIVVADSDILDDRFWVTVQNFFGQQVVQPQASNADFVQNAVDALAGTGELIGLRSRGSVVRPFDVVERMQKSAEDRYQTEQKTLTDKLKDAQGKLNDLRATKGPDGKLELTPEQEKAVDQFSKDIIETRQQLRDVQHKLRADIERLKGMLVLLDVGLVPLGVALAAIALGILRALKRKRHAAAV